MTNVEHDIFLVDSHCHLNDPKMCLPVSTMLEHAKRVGVPYVVTVNTLLEELTELQRLSRQYANVFYTAGIHPHHAQTYHPHALAVEQWLNDPKWVALGETGLDYYYNDPPYHQQHTSFRAHLNASQLWDVPIIIHTRQADEDSMRILDEYPTARGVFHCFSGSEKLAREALDRGYYLSFSGIITFKKSEVLRDIVAQTPMDRILVETDAPYLTPVPYRGQVNEPAHTRITAEQIALIKGTDLRALAQHTTRNFLTLFTRATLPDFNG